MDYVIKRASSLTEEEQSLRGITGIPQDWPVEKYPYVDSVPDGYEQISEENLQILIDNNQASYDAWLASKMLARPAPSPLEVVTQFEKRDKTLKLAHGEATVDSETGLATVLIKIPGTPNSGDGRWISCGIGFFDVHTPGDKVLGVYFTDEDNLLGYGAGTVIGSYTDDDAAEENRGWAVPPSGWLKAEAVGGYGFGPSGFYIKVIGKKAGESPSGKFYINMEWGKVEA